MARSIYLCVLASLAAWRVTHLLHAEAGPWGVLTKLRGATGTTLLGRALGCFYCASVWVSAPMAFAVGAGWAERLLLWPALSAAAILIEERRGRGTVAPAFYVEDAAATGEGGDVQLQQ